jgi:hypothetical protein
MNEEDVRERGWGEEKADAAGDGLRSLRLVSREFNTIITPLVYECINFSDDCFMTRLTHVTASPCEAVKVSCPSISKVLPLTRL